MQIQHEEKMQRSHSAGGEQTIPRIPRPTDEDRHQAQRRQAAEDEPNEVEEQVRVMSVDEGGKEEDHAVGEPREEEEGWERRTSESGECG